jgi:hypothetical protein
MIELMAHCAYIQRPNPAEPYYSQNFINRIFPQLHEYHQEKKFELVIRASVFRKTRNALH